MKGKSYLENEILESAVIGWEVEFFVEKDKGIIAEELSKILGKRVVVPKSIPALGKKSIPVYHSPIKATKDIYKLEADYSGGPLMSELVTGPLPYLEAFKQLKLILDYLDREGYTNERSAIQSNVSFNKDKLDLNGTIQTMDPLKFILNFNEKEIFELWPNRKDIPYASSIKDLLPNSVLFYRDLPTNGNYASLFKIPDEKYFGVNFTKQPDGYLELRYMGGTDYEQDPPKIKKTVDSFILTLYDTLQNPTYTPNDEKLLRAAIDKNYKLIEVCNNPKKFVQSYPNLIISVDMTSIEQSMLVYWARIKEFLFDIITKGKVTEGEFNFDTAVGQAQLQNAKSIGGKFENLELINCDLTSCSINECTLFNCDVKGSRVNFSKAERECKFENCRIEEVHLKASNELTNSYVANTNAIINCKMTGGVLRKGEIGSIAKLKDVLEVGKNKEEGGNVIKTFDDYIQKILHPKRFQENKESK